MPRKAGEQLEVAYIMVPRKRLRRKTSVPGTELRIRGVRASVAIGGKPDSKFSL